MSRARDLSKLVNPSLFSVDTSNNLGVNSTSPDAKLDVVGIVSATAFYGDGSNLEGVASAGLGTALGEEGGLEVIYYTDNVLTIGSTITVDPPASTNVAYTQYSDIAVSGDADLIVADGDDLVPDILGLSTEGVTPIVGSGGRVRADNFTSHSGNGAPSFPNGVNVTGVVTATTATFSGDVSVGGTLTYQDVTNVDSVGLITARSGISIGAGQSVGSNSGTVTYYGDGSNLTGVQAGVANFTASGTVPNGATVVIKDDGTVGIVTQTGSSDPTVGTPVPFQSADSEHISCAFDSDTNKVVIAYREGSSGGDGYAIVGTVSGSNINFGNAAVFTTNAVSYVSATFDSSNNKVVVAYKDDTDSNRGKAVVGDVSGTTITFGSVVQFESGSVEYVAATFDSNVNRVVITFRNGSQGGGGQAAVGTVNASNNSISFGNVTEYTGNDCRYQSITFDSSNNKVVIAYRNQTQSYKGYAVVCTVNTGTNQLDYGSIVEWESSNVEFISATFDSSVNRVVIVYRDAGNTDKAEAIVGQVSGTNITFGSSVLVNNAVTTLSSSSATFDSANGKVIAPYRDGGDSNKGKVKVGTVDPSNNSISFGSATEFESGNTYPISAVFDSNAGKVVIGYRDGGNSNYGTAVVFGTNSIVTNLTTENYIGIAAEAISNGATGKVNIVSGINEGQTGLTTAKTYYVQNDGSLGLSAGIPSVVAGTSISATKIIVKG